MPQMIDLVPSVPFYRLISELDGTEYVFDVAWNGRAGAWFLTISDTEEDVIAPSVKLCLGAVLGHKVYDDRMPPGALVMVDLSETGTEAGFDDLGVRVPLYYYAESEL